MAALDFRLVEKTVCQTFAKHILFLQRLFSGIFTKKTPLSYHKLILISKSNHWAMADFARSNWLDYASMSLSGLSILTLLMQSGCISSWQISLHNVLSMTFVSTIVILHSGANPRLIWKVLPVRGETNVSSQYSKHKFNWFGFSPLFYV